MERDNTFRRGYSAHIDAPVAGLKTAAEIVAQVNGDSCSIVLRNSFLSYSSLSLLSLLVNGLSTYISSCTCLYVVYDK